MPDIRPTPVQNKAAYYLAGLLDSANEAVSAPFGIWENRPVRMLTNLLGIPSAIKTLENVAYGMPNTYGSGFATQLRPEAKETVGNFLPGAPAAAKAAVNGAVKTAKWVAPVAGQMAENYAVKTGVIQPLIAWHGSPHRFDKFDISKVGTGEGAQAYGHGMYFADNKGVANYYANMRNAGADNWTSTLNDAVKNADSIIAKHNLELIDPDEISRLNELAGGELTLEEATAWDYLMKHPTGNLYKVEIPDSAVATFLDWDKSFANQPQNVQENLKRALELRKQQTGGYGLFDQLDQTRMEDLVKSIGEQRLHQSGIQGIRYLDRTSRNIGDGTSNYVVFDPSNVKILERMDIIPSLLDE